MSESDAEVFNDSFERCLSRPGMLERFYELYLASSDEVRAKFARTDMKRQAGMLKASLFMLLSVAGECPLPDAVAHLDRIAERHDRHHVNVEPHLYDLWLDCLVRAVREFDPRFDGRVEAAWRRVLGHGIAIMKASY